MSRAICRGVVLLSLLVSVEAWAGVGPQLVINEIDYDQTGTDTEEFIELKNISGGTVDLSAFELDLRNGVAATNYDTIALPAVILAAGDYFVICEDNTPLPPTVPNCDHPVVGFTIQNGAPDAVAVRLAGGGAIEDTVSYEGDVPGFVETSGVGLDDDPNIGVQSISRFPDGVDTAINNVDLSPRCSTPGVTNSADVVCPVCGNDIIETGEDCDDGTDNGTLNSCCDSGCSFQPVSTACGDPTDDDCLNPDTCDGANTCLTNDEVDGTACTDDANECTDDICTSGVCTHPALTDGTACTDDANDCTNDICTTGVCTHPDLTAGTACGDGSDTDCLNPDSCDGAGTCLGNDEVDGTACTTDGIECTNDICGSGVCTHPNFVAGTACGDPTDDDCLNPDSCDGAGACLGNDEVDGTACTDDANECTNDICGSGVCTHPALSDGTACTDDGNDCTADECTTGACTHPNLIDGTACGDPTDDDCLNPDACDGAGTCLPLDEADGTACTDDGVECTDDICGSGACTHPNLTMGTACGDSTDDDCLNPDTCDGAGACSSNDEADGTTCTDDGVECTNDVCASGACTHPAIADGEPCADDGLECTNDICTTGVCVHPNLTDGTACTADANDCTDDFCTAGACTHPSSSAGTTCGDGTDDDCTDPDTCNGTGTCLTNHEADGVACTDNGAFCDGDETCAAGACASAGDPCDSDSFETCDETDDICVRPPCGDGVIEGDEECDDFNFDNNDGCTDCVLDDGWVCGDTDADGIEECFDTCGDGDLDEFEECEDGGTANGDGCDDNCRVEDGYECVEGDGGLDECMPVCGDGILLDDERCDDGNTVADDGCTGCTVDDGFVCDTQEPSVCVDAETGEGGCGCRVGGRSAPGAPIVLLFAGLLAVMRRRRCAR